MAMKSTCARLGAVFVCAAVVFVCSQNASLTLMAAPAEPATVVPPPVLLPPVLVQLPGRRSIEISGDKKDSVTDEDGTLSIVGGTNLKIAGRVPWKGKLRCSGTWRSTGRSKAERKARSGAAL